MEDKNITVFMCGKPRDHECDDLGPELFGGEDDIGNYWQGTKENIAGRKITWGSVSCSRCGLTAIEASVWSDF